MGSRRVNDREHTTRVVVQLNTCDRKLQGGSHELDLQSPLDDMTRKVVFQGS